MRATYGSKCYLQAKHHLQYVCEQSLQISFVKQAPDSSIATCFLFYFILFFLKMHDIIGTLSTDTGFKGEVQFLHIKPHNKDTSDHIRCSTALL